MSTAFAQAIDQNTVGPAAWRTSVVGLEPLKRAPFDIRLCPTAVWGLQSGLVKGAAISRTGAPEEIEAADLEEIDVACFAYAAAILESNTVGVERLWVPISFVTLATQRARERLLRLTDKARDNMREILMIEICELEAVPPSRLMEVAGLVRGLCLGVVARARPSRAALEAVRGCGLGGVSVDGPRLGLEMSDPAARLNAFAAATRDIGADRLVHDLPSTGMIDLAAAAGFSPATVAATAPEV